MSHIIASDQLLQALEATVGPPINVEIRTVEQLACRSGDAET